MLLTSIIKREIKQAIVWALKQPNMEYIVSHHHMYHSGSAVSIAQIPQIHSVCFLSLMLYCISYRAAADDDVNIRPLCRPQHTSMARLYERVCK